MYGPIESLCPVAIHPRALKAIALIIGLVCAQSCKEKRTLTIEKKRIFFLVRTRKNQKKKERFFCFFFNESKIRGKKHEDFFLFLSVTNKKSKEKDTDERE